MDLPKIVRFAARFPEQRLNNGIPLQRGSAYKPECFLLR
jgi:hypothetical protein